MRWMTARDILTDADLDAIAEELAGTWNGGGDKGRAASPSPSTLPPLVMGGQGHPADEIHGDAWAVFRFMSALSALLSIWAAVQWAMGGG